MAFLSRPAKQMRPGTISFKSAAVMLLSIGMLFSLLALSVYSMVRTTITIDGSFSDWQQVLGDSDNIINDTFGIDDPDSDHGENPNFTSDRDLVRFASTWDNTYLYLYFKVSTASSKQTSFILYIDRDNDGTLTSSDYLLDMQFNGTNFVASQSSYYYYSPSSPSGDAVTGDGTPEPGSRGSKIGDFASNDGAGGGEGNLEKEVRISWTGLGLSPGTPVRFHISTGQGTSSLPNQVIDNAGPKSTLFTAISLDPVNQNSSASTETVVGYRYTVTNSGNGTDTINLSALSNQGWEVHIYDATGNTTITSVSLAPDSSTTVVLKITVPADATSGVTDITTLTGISTVNPGISDSSTAMTTIGTLTVIPDNTGTITTGTAISYAHTINNNTGTTDTINLSAVSSQGWSVVFKDITGSTTITSVSVGSSSSAGIIVFISVPATATIGSQDVTIIRGTSTNDPGVSDEAIDTTTVQKRVLIEPDNTGAGGAGSTVSYNHTITNSGSTTDTIRLAFATDTSWTVKIYDYGGIDETSSVTLGPNGATADIIVKVTIPSGVTSGTVNSTTITATSSLNTSYFDIAVDRTSVQQLVTYSDPGRTNQSSSFRLGDSVYARASNLDDNKVYRFVWLDGGDATVKTSEDIDANSNGIAEDSYTMSGTETVGSWTLILYVKSGGSWSEVTRTQFSVSYDAEITSLTATDAPDLNTTVTVDSAVRNDSEQTITASKINYVIWWDEDGSGTFNAGDKYIGPDGLSYTWNGTSTVSTHETTGIAVSPNGGTWGESGPGWGISNLNFPYRGTYKVTATWRTSSGLLIDEKTTSFYSVPVFGYPLLCLFGGVTIALLYRKRIELDMIGLVRHR